jgi:hypothetical protein
VVSSILNLSPVEFEKWVIKRLEGVSDGVGAFEIHHRKKLANDRGNRYEFDATTEFVAYGVRYTTIIECKRWTSPIDRDTVLVLYGKLNEVGAQKAVLVSTSPFQKGAIELARSKGIALIRVREDGTVKTVHPAWLPVVEVTILHRFLKPTNVKYFVTTVVGVSAIAVLINNLGFNLSPTAETAAAKMVTIEGATSSATDPERNATSKSNQYDAPPAQPIKQRELIANPKALAKAGVQRSTPPQNQEPRIVTIDTPSSRIVKIDTRPILQQQGAHWCWAASIQNVLSTYGVDVEQQDIVRMTWGRVVDLPAFDPRQAVEGLLAVNAFVAPGKVVHPFFQNDAPAASFLVREIEVEKAPVIVFYRNSTDAHVVVCYGIEYTGTPTQPRITNVFVRDPATGAEVTWRGTELASVWSATIFCRVAPHPKASWEFQGVRYSSSPYFDVFGPQGVVGRIWYHREDSKWHVWDNTGDRGAIP